MNDAQKQLLVRAENSLKAAHTLLEDGFYEDSISRAYYAMFYMATAILQSQHIHIHSHTGVLSSIGQYFVKPGLLKPEYHRYLIDAEDSRRQADYDINAVINKLSAEKQLERAEAFIAMGKQYLMPPTGEESDG